MGLNSLIKNFKLFFLDLGLFIREAALIHLNKMVLLRELIDTSLTLLEL